MSYLASIPPNFQRRIASAIAESLGLKLEDVYAAVLHIRATLDATTTADTDDYEIPGGLGFFAWAIHGHIAMNQISSEATSGGVSVLEWGTLRERALLKAMNCDWKLANLDAASAGLDFVNDRGSNTTGDSNALGSRLSSLLPDAGGGPIVLAQGNDVLPMIVRPKQKLRGTFTLQTTNDTRLTRQAEYGVALWGAFFRV